MPLRPEAEPVPVVRKYGDMGGAGYAATLRGTMLLENVPISVMGPRVTTRLLGKQAPSQELGAELEEAREVGR